MPNMNRLLRIIPTANWKTHTQTASITLQIKIKRIVLQCDCNLVSCFYFPILTTISGHFFSLQAPNKPSIVKSRVKMETAYMTCRPAIIFSICGENRSRSHRAAKLIKQTVMELNLHMQNN